MSTRTLTSWMSISKTFTACAMAILWERGLVDIFGYVRDYIEDFSKNGKEEVKISDLLSHTAGMKEVEIGGSYGWPDNTWEERIALICQAPLIPDWTPGQRAGYDVVNAWMILAEIIQRTSGKNISDFVRDEIFQPLDMRDCYLSMEKDVCLNYGDLIGGIYFKRDNGLEPFYRYANYADCCHDVVPGGSGRGPANQLAKFYEMLLNFGSNGERALLKPQTVTAVTRRQRIGLFDEVLCHIVDMGLGYYMNSNIYGENTVPYGFGRHASDLTFGNAGYQTSIAFADPVFQVVTVCVFNVAPGEPAHQKRNRQVCNAVYEELGFDGKYMPKNALQRTAAKARR